jgi:NhaP-type Na+/H+ or K+/H+ antiporter
MLLAEAAANDGLGFPFLFMALYLMLIKEPDHARSTIGQAVGAW